MTLRYKLFGIPGSLEELTDKAKEKKSPVNIKVETKWICQDRRLDIHAPRYDVVLRTRGGKVRIKGNEIPFPGKSINIPLFGYYSPGSAQDYQKYHDREEEGERNAHLYANEVAETLRKKGLQIAVINNNH